MNDTVLVIDDEREIQALLTDALRAAGFGVEGAASGEEGRRRLDRGGIDVVLLDYRLPGGEDGVTCLQAIVRRHPGLPVVMMTAHGSQDVAVEAMKSGAVDYVVKEGVWTGTACQRVEAAARARRQCGPVPAEPGHVPPPATGEAVLAAELQRWEASGPDSGMLTDVRTALAASAAASAAFHHGEAARHLQRATLGLDGSTGAACRLWVTLITAESEALRRAGAERDARSRAEQAIVRARALDDPELLARAALAYAGRQQGFGDAMPDGAVADVLREVLRALPVEDSALRALTMARLAEELAVTVTVDDRRSLGREAMRMARRLDDPAVIASVIHTAHWALWHPEESDNRLMLADEAIALAERLADRATLLEGALLRFWCLLDVGDFAGAKTQLEVASRLVEATGQPYYEWLVLMGRTALAYGAAPVPDVEALAAAAVSAGHRAQNPNAALFYAAQVGSLAWLTGRDTAVDASLADIVADVPALGPTVQCARAIMWAETGRVEEARVILRELLDDGSWRAIRNIAWLPAMSFLAEACAVLRDVRVARELYEALRPFDGRLVTLPPLILYGPVSYYLGRLAATLGDWDRAVRHFDDALELAGRAHAYRWLARTQVACSTMLLERGERDDVLLARARLSGAARMAVDLGMEGLSRQVERLQVGRGDNGVGPPTVAVTRAVEASPAAEFRCEGEFWHLEFGGRRTLMRDLRGFRYLRDLLERPGEQVSALLLVAGLDTVNGILLQNGIPRGADAAAVAAYRRELRDLATEMAEAEERGDLGLLEQLRDTSEMLQAEIDTSCGLGGRPRVGGDTANCARTNVRKAVTGVYARLRGSMPELLHHLETHVKTGTALVYRPDPARPVVWRTR